MYKEHQEILVNTGLAIFFSGIIVGLLVGQKLSDGGPKFLKELATIDDDDDEEDEEDYYY